MENRLVFTKISETNIDIFARGISELYCASNVQAHTPEYWHWRYLKGPAGQGSLIVALRGKRVVGVYGLLYLPLIINGRVIRAGLIGGLLVHPSERFWQCYRGLVEKHNIENRGAISSFSFGISASCRLELHKRLGVMDLGPLTVYLGFLNVPRALEGHGVPYPISLSGYIAQAVIGLHPGRDKAAGMDIRSVRRFDSGFDALWEGIKERRRISIIKDSAYLNWRYAENPENRYNCLAAYNGTMAEGLVVFCATGSNNGGYILELFARHDNIRVVRGLLSHALSVLKLEGVGCVTASFPVISKPASVARAAGFKPWGTKPWSMHMIISAGSYEGIRPVLRLKNWDFSIGDLLVY